MRQFWAIALLSWRFLTRTSPRSGKSGFRVRTSLAGPLAMGVLASGLTSGLAFAAYKVSQVSSGRATATTVLLGAWMFVALGLTANFEAAPLSEKLPPGLPNPAILDPFPVTLSNRVLFLVARVGILSAGLVPFICCLAPERFASEWPALALLGLEFFVVSILASKVVSLGLRVALRPNLARRALGLIGGGSLLAGMGLMYAALSARTGAFQASFARFVPFLRPLGSLLAASSVGSDALEFLGLGLVGGVSYCLLWILDRQGYDRGLAATPGKPKRSRGRLTLDRVEWLLLRRHQSAAARWIVVGMGLAGSVWLSVAFMRGETPRFVGQLLPELPLGIVYVACLLGFEHARQQASHDRDARPLLASLPLSPSETLGSKIRALRLLIIPPFLWLLPLLVATRFESGFLWRSMGAGVGLWLVVGAIVPVSFFNAGAGGSGPLSGRVLDRVLILLPLIAALVAPSPLLALPSLGALALVAWEARRAAALHVRWSDDASDDLDRDTPVWRALLVFAAFAGIEGFFQVVLGALPEATILFVSYLAASVVLILLTLNGRDGLPALSWVGTRRWLGTLRWPGLVVTDNQRDVGLSVPVGAAAGALAGLIAVAYMDLVERIAEDPRLLSNAYQRSNDLGRALLAGAAILLAPLAEEMFFRGWLQAAIKVELPARWKRCAFVLAAFAFASVHPGLAFPPVFLLGLVAGLLYETTGGILAGIFAHAAYNAVVTFVQF